MQHFESKFFGLQMQIPDGWSMFLGSEAGLKSLVREAEHWDPTDWSSACFRNTKYLLSASLKAPGGWLDDARIELQACITTDANMLAEDKTKWNVNGIAMRYKADRKEGHRSPEAVHYRFASWKVGTQLWLHARIQATGKARFDYALSVFETLAPTGTKPRKKKPLYESEPWTIPPKFFQMRKEIDESRPFYDLVFTRKPSAGKIFLDNQILEEGMFPHQLWVPLRFKRRSRVLSLDCYRGEKQNVVYQNGIYSARTIELLRPYMQSNFTLLPCAVNGKPYFFPIRDQPTDCLDRKTSLIKYFEHDGRISKVERYRFKRSAPADPNVFALPEERLGIYTTAGIPRIVAEAGLKGIAFDPVDGHGREFTCPG